MTEPRETFEAVREIWFKSAGTPLFAVEQGPRQELPVLFMHGGMADHRAALLRFDAMAKTHRMIAPDVRGAGRSIYAGELSWDLLADDVAALMDHLGVDRAVVGGMSAGSAVALRFALRHPERVRALLLIWPVFAGEDVGLLPAQKLAMERMNEFGKRALNDGIEALLPLYAALPPQIRDIAVAMARGFDPASVAATTRFLASGAQPIARDSDLGALSVPTLIVPGLDPEHPAEIAGRYAAAIPDAVLSEPTADLAAVVGAFLDSRRDNRVSPVD